MTLSLVIGSVSFRAPGSAVTPGVWDGRTQQATGPGHQGDNTYTHSRVSWNILCTTALHVCGHTLVTSGCNPSEGGGRRWITGADRVLKSNPEASVECSQLGLVCRFIALGWLSVVYFRLNQLLALDGSFTMMIQH